MAKHKRKPSASQRDKRNIAIARILKEKGILSKQTKLHGGHYISRDVLRKTREYEHQAALGYKAVSVTKELAKAAKERGFQVVQGNKIIGPADGRFAKRLKSGVLTGIRPVKGGYMEEVSMPHTVMDMQSLVAQLEEGIDTLKMPDEYFAFKYKGNESYRAFPNTQEMLNYLRHYKGIFDAGGAIKPEDMQEEFAGLSFFRLHEKAYFLNIPGPTARKKRKAQQRAEAIARGEYVQRRKRPSRSEWLAGLHPAEAERIRANDKKRSERKRKALLNDPEKLAISRAKAKARAKASRDRRK